MDTEFGLLNDDEVLYIRAGRILIANPTFKISEFLDALAQTVSEREDDWNEDCEGWFNGEGLPCEVLKFGNQGWQRGRVRIRLEFCPDNQPKLLREQPPSRRVSRDDPYRQDLYPKRNEFYDDNLSSDY